MAASDWLERVLRYVPLGARLVRVLRRRRGLRALREWELQQRRARDERLRRRERDPDEP